jgi:ribosomal protein L18E
MPGKEVVEPAVKLLSVAIGMIMEDHVDEAVSIMASDLATQSAHFEKLRQAGSDVVTLADAAEVLLRRSS